MASHHKFRQIGFAHLMEHLPFHTFRRWVQRYLSKYPTKLFSHLDQFLCMAFAQLTCHESLCNTETCLRCDRTIALTSSQSQQGLPTAPATNQVLRCRARQASGSSNRQHRRIKHFYETTEYAVKTQKWIAIAVYVLLPS